MCECRHWLQVSVALPTLSFGANACRRILNRRQCAIVLTRAAERHKLCILGEQQNLVTPLTRHSRTDACICRSAYAVVWRKRLPTYLQSLPVCDRPDASCRAAQILHTGRAVESCKAYRTLAAIPDTARKRQRQATAQAERQIHATNVCTRTLATHVHSSSARAVPYTAKPRHARVNRQNGVIQRVIRLRR